MTASEIWDMAELAASVALLIKNKLMEEMPTIDEDTISRFAVNEVSKCSYEQLLIMRSKFGD